MGAWGGVSAIDSPCQTRSGISVVNPHGIAIYPGIVLLSFAPNLFLGRRTVCHCRWWVAPFMVVSELVPFKPNMSGLGKRVQASRNNVEDYLVYMEKAGMIALLRSGASGLGALGKTEKVYLDNPNILYNLCDNCDVGTVRETFFFNQMRVNQLVTSSEASDFEIGGRTFEVGGGPGKGQSQIRDAVEGYVVRDGIEYGYGNVIPLWAFGLNY